MKRTLLFFILLALSLCPAGLRSQTFLDFPGGNANVFIGAGAIKPPWTLEVTISKNENSNYQHLLTSSDSVSGIRCEQFESSRVGFTLKGVDDYYFKYTLPERKWVCLSVVCDGAETRLYADGVLKGSEKAVTDLPLCWIGRPGDEGALLAGIREIRVWNTALSDSLLTYWKDKDPFSGHPFYSYLLHWYRFDEGRGNMLHDMAGHADGKINGARWVIPAEKDLGLVRRVLPSRNPDNYGDSEVLSVRLRNYGTQVINGRIRVSCMVDGKESSVGFDPGTAGMKPGETRDISFPPADMNRSGAYRVGFRVYLEGDQNPLNDTLEETLVSDSHVLGNVTSMRSDSSCFTFDCGSDRVRLIFYTPVIFRIWLAVNGEFSDPASEAIIARHSFPKIKISRNDAGDYYSFGTGKLFVRVYRKPLRFALYDRYNKKCIWEERTPLDYGPRTFQYLKPGGSEAFYGCGMQNGYFAHTGRQVTIGLRITNWDEGAVPNPVPFYMSTAGYGAFRNTFAPGFYDFTDSRAFAHDEKRFDCFYFYGSSLKDVLNLYTSLTGRPFMPPRWGLELGDANCYNRKGQSTPVVIGEIADKYRENLMPGGWILPNDGYGCGYVKLDSVSAQLAARGFHTGLWTENGLSKLPWEVGTAGVRAYKLDVAWVGPGYRQALDACRQAFNGIESNSNARGFVWSVCGWAGTQRYSTVWSGDQKGSWEYIRFHIPTIIGAGLSGFSNASSDLDGIFGGSAKTYIRDLEWKTFIPEFYAMSGWAAKNRQPWVYGEPYTSISRDYLNLKMQMVPYLYSYCHKAFETGVPVVRAMALEFPGDSLALGNRTRYQFLCGEWILVAPVFRDTTLRDSIYLPSGRWTDFWTGQVYIGPATINGYPAPLSRIPLFIRSGAIIPTQSKRLYDSQGSRDTITLDIYPDGSTAFEFYEDDGESKDFRSGAFTKTMIGCRAPEASAQGPLYVAISPAKGDYQGKPAKRSWIIRIHKAMNPSSVILDDSRLKEFGNSDDLMRSAKGYCRSKAETGDLTVIRTPSLSTAGVHLLKIMEASGGK